MTDAGGDQVWIQDGLTRMKVALTARTQESGEASKGLSAAMPRSLSAPELAELGVQKRHVALLLEPGLRRPTTSMAAAASFAADDQVWCLLLAGETGVGKTLAAEWALAELTAQKGISVQRRRGQKVFTVPFLRRAWFDASLMKSMCNAPIIVLDDLGSEPEDRLGFTGAALFEVINTRWGKSSKTILTTNLPPSLFQKRYNQRVTDRVLQGGSAVIVRGFSLRSSV